VLLPYPRLFEDRRSNWKEETDVDHKSKSVAGTQRNKDKSFIFLSAGGSKLTVVNVESFMEVTQVVSSINALRKS